MSVHWRPIPREAPWGICRGSATTTTLTPSLPPANAPCQQPAPPWNPAPLATASAALSPTWAPSIRPSRSTKMYGSTANAKGGSAALHTLSTTRPYTSVTTAASVPPTSPAPSPLCPAALPRPLFRMPAPSRPRMPPFERTRRPQRPPPHSPTTPASSSPPPLTPFPRPIPAETPPRPPTWPSSTPSTARPPPSSRVTDNKTVLHNLWWVTHKADLGNGNPAERARFCVADNRD